MPIIVNERLPAFKKLQEESVFELSTKRASTQDIRPLEIGILNLMPSATVERTELQLLRLLANTPLHIHPTFICFDNHVSRSTQGHFDAFYKTIEQVKKSGLDGLIVTGANLEHYAFEDVFFWEELASLFAWARKNVTSTLYLCWAAHAALYHRYGVRPIKHRKKIFGVFPHVVHHETRSPFLAGMDDQIYVPHARRRGIASKKLRKLRELQTLIEGADVGVHLVSGRGGRELYVQGHPEYDRNDIAEEYARDIARGERVAFPKGYFLGDDTKNQPQKNWGANAQVFYANWVNWVYQTTHVDVKKPLMD